MKRLVSLIASLFPLLAWAHGPTPQKVVESVELNVPAEKVWELIKDFGGISVWNPALTKSEGGGGNQPGGKRTLSFPNGEQLVEELDTYDGTTHEYSYRLHKENVKALPASSYSAVLKLTTAGAGSKLEWKSRLYRGDTGNTPPDELSDEAAVKAMQGFFRAGLDRLKQKLESGG